MNHLAKYKNETLNQLSVLCGSTIKSTKTEKCHQLLSNLNFYLQLPPKFNLIGIDIGIKNFSFCKIRQFDITNFDNQNGLVILPKDWKTIDLLAKYPIESPEFQKFNTLGQFEFNDLIKSKYYVSFLNEKVLGLLATKSSVMNVFLIESQRIKSNNNKMTLPNILTNYLFESLFYANMLGKHQLLLPMNSNKMANFMINRFVEKKVTSSNSKKLRLKLLLFMVNKKLIDLPGLDLGQELPKLQGPDPLQLTSRSLLQYYNTNNPDAPIKKLDDFFDSYLYNLNFIYNYRNNLLLQHWLLEEKDISMLVQYLNGYQMKPTEEFFSDQLNKELEYQFNMEQVRLGSISRDLWKV